ncbi:hypothetical protein EPUL_000162 [Erysiphe pulchra]|uniref:Uncharacterized protein n=1 Tax=Erysiphe pulchra TaxID=225359 RepID=A0A2S4Q2D1_9PEZI|nr:hypothetical protein EPUL_000162 [Erysiphe pulchra]
MGLRNYINPTKNLLQKYGILPWVTMRGLLNAHRFSSGLVPLGSFADIYDAEIAAVVSGAQAALVTAEASFSKNDNVCLANEAAAVILPEEYKDFSSSKYLTEFNTLRENWHTRPRGVYWLPTAGNVNIRWCPGQSGFEGNGKADALAKEVCSTGTELDFPNTIRHAKTKIEERYTSARTSFCEENAPQRYIDLGLKAKENIPFTLKLPREALGNLLISRTGLGDFSQYHTRFNHQNAEHNFVCGSFHNFHNSEVIEDFDTMYSLAPLYTNNSDSHNLKSNVRE